MRRRRGISMNIIISPETLATQSVPMSLGDRQSSALSTYRHSILNIIVRGCMWKKFAIPRAMQRNMHSMPSLRLPESALFETM